MGSYSISVYATSPVSIRELVFTLNAYDFGPKLMAFPKSDTQYEEMKEGGREEEKGEQLQWESRSKRCKVEYVHLIPMHGLVYGHLLSKP